MPQLKIVDAGTQFGMPCGQLFAPWNPTIYEPKKLATWDELIAVVKPDLLLFGGGQDVHPHLYGHANYGSGVGSRPSIRDYIEQELWSRAVAAKIPILGICRGAQLACALSGGALIQDIRGHGLAGTHLLKTSQNEEFEINSVHHQMMYPDKVEHELLAWTTNITKSNAAYDVTKITLSHAWFNKEPEIVYFPKTNALAVQGHPEWMARMSHAAVYIRNLVATKLLNRPDLVVQGNFKRKELNVEATGSRS